MTIFQTFKFYLIGGLAALPFAVLFALLKVYGVEPLENVFLVLAVLCSLIVSRIYRRRVLSR